MREKWGRRALLFAALFLLAGAIAGGWAGAAAQGGVWERWLGQGEGATLAEAAWHSALALGGLWLCGWFGAGLPFLAAGLALWAAGQSGRAALWLARGGGWGRVLGALPGGLLRMAAVWMVGSVACAMVLFRFYRRPPQSCLRRERRRRQWAYILVGAGCFGVTVLGLWLDQMIKF